MEIGAFWKKKSDKTGKVYYSGSFWLPGIGEFNAVMVANDNYEENSNKPVMKLLLNKPKKEKQTDEPTQQDPFE